MANRQYIGARYVPKFADPVEWNKTLSYEALTIVTHLGNSFTSKKPVPAGIDIGNGEYWVNTGNYNEQVSMYAQQVATLQENVEDISTKFAPYSTTIAVIPADAENNQLSIVQNAINNQQLIVLASGTHKIEGTLSFNSDHRGTVIIGAGECQISGDTLNFDGSNASYYHSYLCCYNIRFNLTGITFTNMNAINFTTFSSCMFASGFTLNGSRHFKFDGCVWRNDVTPIDAVIKISNANFNGDCLFTNCEFICNQLSNPYVADATPYTEFRGMHFTSCVMFGGISTAPYINFTNPKIRVLDWFFTDCQFDQIASNQLVFLQGHNTVASLKNNINLNGCNVVFSGQNATFAEFSVSSDINLTNCNMGNGKVTCYESTCTVNNNKQVGAISLQGSAIMCVGNTTKAAPVVTSDKKVVDLNLIVS